MNAESLGQGVKMAGGFKVGTYAFMGAKEGTIAVDPASLGAGALGTVSLTIAGVATTDIVVLEPAAALEATLVYRGCRVTAADTVVVDIVNVSAGTVDGASRTWTYKVLKLRA